MAFGKGKGKGKRGGGAGPPFRPASGAKGGGKGGFTGTCFYCGEPGHRRSECAKYTAHLKGGGGAHPGALNQVSEEDATADTWATWLAEEEGFAPVLNGELNSLAAEVPTFNQFDALAE